MEIRIHQDLQYFPLRFTKHRVRLGFPCRTSVAWKSPTFPLEVLLLQRDGTKMKEVVPTTPYGSGRRRKLYMIVRIGKAIVLVSDRVGSLSPVFFISLSSSASFMSFLAVWRQYYYLQSSTQDMSVGGVAKLCIGVVYLSHITLISSM